MAATILWGALAAWIDRGTPRVRLLAAAIVVSLVGVSRLALGVHYLVDVLASVGVGAGYLLVATRIADGEPTRAFAGATVLGGGALITAGSTDGWQRSSVASAPRRVVDHQPPVRPESAARRHAVTASRPSHSSSPRCSASASSIVNSPAATRRANISSIARFRSLRSRERSLMS